MFGKINNYRMIIDEFQRIVPAGTRDHDCLLDRW
jgi:hypothetical protein